MRIVAIRHVPYEGPGAIADWAAAREHDLTVVDAVTGEFPELDSFDLLAVMGGPMGVYDIVGNPWLAGEKDFVARTIDAGRLVVGVCLGSQILADAIGGSVHPGTNREIGWYAVRLTPAGRASTLFAEWPDEFVAGHWHGDTFDLPPAVASAASSVVTPNQAFEACDGRVVGLQFHLEWKNDGLRALVRACSGDLDTRLEWVEPAGALLDVGRRLDTSNRLLFALLDRLEARL